MLTNTTFTDAYRGAGRPEATYAIERLMDDLATAVGVDPLEIRERNWIKHEEFPFTTVAGLEYDSGNYEAATARGGVGVRLSPPRRSSKHLRGPPSASRRGCRRACGEPEHPIPLIARERAERRLTALSMDPGG